VCGENAWLLGRNAEPVDHTHFCQRMAFWRGTAGVKMGFGTDLLGPQHVRQCTEFTLRAQALPAIDILRSACTLNAELMCLAGNLGCVRNGSAADVLLVNGNPLDDISILARSGDGLAVIMKAGEFHKRDV
jgi:imidazolonepropionase-like amidohydrolase